MSAYVPQPYNELLDSSLSYAAQTLTDPQKAQALTNLGAASVAYVGANFAPISHNHSADNITSGALAKARQHAQTPYKDEANTWTLAQTFSSTIEVNGSGIATRYGLQINELSNGSSQWLVYKSNGSGEPLIFRDLVNSRSHFSLTPAATAASSRVDVSSNLYCSENLQADKGVNATINNSWIGFSDGNNYIGGVSNFRSGAGGSATTIIDGANGFIASRVFRHLNSSGESPWMIYSPGTDPNWYVRDLVNSRMHLTFVPGASTTAASTTIHSALTIDGAATFSGSTKLAIKTIATLPSAASSSGERYQVSDSATVAYRIAFSNGSAWYYEGTAVAV